MFYALLKHKFNILLSVEHLTSELQPRVIEKLMQYSFCNDFKKCFDFKVIYRI